VLQQIVVRGLWRRTDSYYARAAWAGRLRLDGQWVLDGPANNPLCHYLHEALFLACREPAGTVRPLAVQAEMYRAHPIEGEDTMCARAELEGGVRMLAYLTLCAPQHHPPRVDLVGSEGEASWTPGSFTLRAAGALRQVSRQGEGTTALLRNLVRAVTAGEELRSPVSATRNVILHNNGCFKSTGRIHVVPPQHVRRYVSDREGEEGQTATEIRGIVETVEEAARRGLLFSEMGVEWAVPTPRVTLGV